MGVWGFGQTTQDKSRKITKPAGMLYYDVEDAEDMQYRRYTYTISPPGATCISLDFRMMGESADGDFIHVYEGLNTAEQPAQSFGADQKPGAFLSETGTITVVFSRDKNSLRTTWSAIWKSRQDGQCIDYRRPQECADVETICGPVYNERKIYEGFGQKNEAGGNSCLPAETNSAWYRFEIARDGDLNFLIRPANGFDDYDWTLWKGDRLKPFVCPGAGEEMAPKIACNYSAARGIRGETGMCDKGRRLESAASGSPYCKSLKVKKGDIFYLLVDNNTGKSKGFSIVLSDAVKQCDTEEEEMVVRIAAPRQNDRPVVRPADQFNRYTKIIRINLDEKANYELANCSLPEGLFSGTPSVYTQKATETFRRPQNCNGLVMALLMGIKSARFPAYSAEDNVTPVHFGDFLQAAYRMDPQGHEEIAPEDSIYGIPDDNWWDADRDLFMHYENALEVIADEVMDRKTGRKRHIVRFIRLVWTDWEGVMPDFNMAVFRYDEIKPMLSRIEVGHPQNDSRRISLTDIIEGQLYSGWTIGREGKNITSLEAAQFEAAREAEFEDYHWSH